MLEPDDAVNGDATDRAESPELEAEADQHQPDTTSTADDTRDPGGPNQRPANDG